MVVLFLMSCVCLLLTYYASKDELPWGLEISFIIIGFFAAIHYNYGTDYQSYLDIFEFLENHEFTWAFIKRKIYFHDPGWAVLCYAFQPLGFLPLVAFIGIVQNIIYYFFVKKYVPKEWWLIGVYIYLFSEELYILNMSMLRQGFAACLFILAFFLIEKFDIKKLPLAFVLIYIASTIHGAAFILYPCLLLVFLKKEWAPFLTIPLFIFLILLLLQPDLVNNFLGSFENLEEIEEYKKYQDRGTARGFSLGVVWRLLPFFVSCYSCFWIKDFNEKELKIILLSMFGFVMIPFSLAIPMIGRLCYFFTPFMIASVPLTYRKLPKPYNYIFLSLEILYLIYGYWNFFHSPTWIDAYYTFHSVFEVLL